MLTLSGSAMVMLEGFIRGDAMEYRFEARNGLSAKERLDNMITERVNAFVQALKDCPLDGCDMIELESLTNMGCTNYVLKLTPKEFKPTISVQYLLQPFRGSWNHFTPCYYDNGERVNQDGTKYEYPTEDDEGE